jgi:hypothetical protein
MAYVPEMNYTPDMGIKIRVGKKFFKKIGQVAKQVAKQVVKVAPLPQAQAINAISNIKIKTKKTSSQPTIQPQPTTEPTQPTEITSENKIFGVDKKVVLIGGGAVGLIMILMLMRKK